MSAAAAVPIREKAVQQPFDVEKIRKDFPILHTKVHGQSAGLPRQRGHIAEAAVGDRRSCAVLRGRKREYSSRRALSIAKRDGGVREGARDGPGLRERGTDERDHLHARDNGGHQPGGADVRSRACGCGR